MSRFLKIAVGVVIVIALVLVGLHFLRPGAGAHGGMHHGPAGAGSASGKAGADPSANGPVPVTVEPVVAQDVPIYVAGLGTVTALNSVTIAPQIAGPLLSLHFVEGQEIKKGDLLALIDPRPYQATLDGDLAKEQQDKASLLTAQSTYDRNKSLVGKGYVTALNMDTYTNNVQQLLATVAADQAAIKGARVQLGYTRIVSPIDGIAGIRQVDPGNQLTTASNIVVLTQIHPIYLIFTLPENTLEDVRAAFGAGQLQVSASDKEDKVALASDGYLQVIDNQVATSTGTYKLRAVFPNTKGELWPGQFANARLRIRTIPGGLVIPTQAVQRGPDGDYVYLVQADKTVKMQPVTVGSEVGDSHVMVTKGLNLNELVVTEGQFRLKPGSKVDALRPGEQPAAPSADDLKKAGAGKHRRGGGHGGG